jgi:alpha-mannosidase
VSADEACPSYEEQIMNILVGHAFLKKTFGVVPKHAWHPDDFGHSSATPEIFAKLGFETISFARMTDEEKNQRKAHKELEFLWKPTFEGPDGPIQSNYSIFVHNMHELYNAPCGMD